MRTLYARQNVLLEHHQQQFFYNEIHAMDVFGETREQAGGNYAENTVYTVHLLLLTVSSYEFFE